MMSGLDAVAARLEGKCAGRLLRDEPLRNHTSFRVGGPADLLFFPASVEDLAGAVKAAREADVPLFVMGNGTNLLVLDGGIRGLTIHTGGLDGIEEASGNGEAGEGGEVHLVLMAGTLLSRVINYSVGRGLSGIEFAAGIPGTVGGGVWMNAGAHGWSFGDIVTWAEIVDEEGEIVRFDRGEIEFVYRGSRWPRRGIIARVGVRLARAPEEEVLEQVKRCLSERGKRLPMGVGMAGSVFKNPPDDYAGRIIEEQGFKGTRVGSAEVSRKHANVIVNIGGATAADVLGLVRKVTAVVEAKTGIRLETEIDIVGEERA
jgi:UDP-N-acetylmuramate dehydrogenase